MSQNKDLYSDDLSAVAIGPGLQEAVTAALHNCNDPTSMSIENNKRKTEREKKDNNMK